MTNPEALNEMEIEESFELELKELKRWIEKPWNQKLTKESGTVIWPSWKETYYNMPMDSVIKTFMKPFGYTMKDYWVRKDWVKMLWKYVMVAANLDKRPRGTVLSTSLWEWIVCDTWGFAKHNPNQLDIAVTWWRQVWWSKKKKKK